MAAKTQEQDEAPETTEGPDGPLLDLNDAAVKKMIKSAKKRGWVTYDELNSVLPSEEVTSEQIEDTMAMLNDMGINVIESEEAEEQDANNDNSDDDNNEVIVGTKTAVAKTTTREPTDRTDDPVR
ncbi:MAG: RNA polymerase sigma factor RpoD, partial [Hyphomicrobiaceae bacterium]|nr:RNA polymerase sigma factor RpoD [Hyphomicrobiaceae bacterium]